MIYSADFETTTAAFKEDETEVWAGGFVDIEKHADDDAVVIFESIYDFQYYLENYFQDKDIIYFHNLKFDGSFIINNLFREGYTYVDDVKMMGKMDVTPEGLAIRRSYHSKAFDALINDMGVWYRIRVHYRKRIIEIRNSLCLIQGSVASIGESFKTRKRKLDIDYDEASTPHLMTDKEIEYLKADIQIMAEVLHYLIVDAGCTKLTAGACAMADFIERFGGKEKFKKYFPLLSLEEDKFDREGYNGGESWVNPLFALLVIAKGCTYDNNSEYPAMMHSSSGNAFPIGKGFHFYGRPGRVCPATPKKFWEKHPLWIAKVSIVAHIKPKKMPCIQIKKSTSFKENEWLTEVSDKGAPVEITITSADWELIQECYDIDVQMWQEGYAYTAQVGLFDKFIDHWNEIKMNSKGAKRQVAKLMMNSFYGKFGTRLHGKSKHIEFVDEMIKFHIGEDEVREGVYLPVACFVTAYGRQNLVRAVNANYDRVVYTDTDSIHLLGWEEPVGIEIDPKKLGAWKLESKWSRGKFLRQKTYVEDVVWPEEDAGLNIKCAGMPDNLKYRKYVGEDGFVHKVPAISFEEFDVGAKWETGKLLAKQVKGGVLLVDTPFQIKAPS